jgi:predicted PurR-regulated permease PerM
LQGIATFGMRVAADRLCRANRDSCWAGMQTSLKTAVLPFDSRSRAMPRAAIAILVVLVAAWVARGFLIALIWAAVIAITLWPIYVRFESRIFGGRSHTLAPLLFTFLIGLVLVVPIVMAVHQIAQGSNAFAQSLNSL